MTGGDYREWQAVGEAEADRRSLAAWLAENAVRADHLGPCAACGEPVRAGDECSTCLEDAGRVVHDDCDHRA